MRWALLACALARRAGDGWGLVRQYPAVDTCAAEAAPDYTAISQLLGQARQQAALLESHHFVAVVPASAAFSTGEAAVSAAAYARLPAAGAGPYTTPLTKVVLVGRSDEVSSLSIADCALTDGAAASWLRSKATLGTASAAALHNQVPFLSLVMEQLSGNVLPLIVGDQTPRAAQQVADLVHSLIQPFGPYRHERVLFVFAGDLSRDLAQKWAAPRDEETVQRLVSASFGAVSEYFGHLAEVQLPGEHRRPVDFAVVLAAVKLARDLGLAGARMAIGNSGNYIGTTDRNQDAKVRGYASVLYSLDTRSAGEKLSAGPQPFAAPPTTTTTSTVAPTIVPPPTSLGPYLMQRSAALLRH